MLAEAHVGLLFRVCRAEVGRRLASDNVMRQFPPAAPNRSGGGPLKAVESYGEMLG